MNPQFELMYVRTDLVPTVVKHQCQFKISHLVEGFSLLVETLISRRWERDREMLVADDILTR